MNVSYVLAAAVPAISLCALATAQDRPPTREQVEQEMGIRSDGDRTRGQVDTTGFATTAAQAEDVIKAALDLEKEALAAQDARLGMKPGQGFVGGVCPHDDHLYAARTAVRLTHRLSAPRVILIGVFHRARLWNLENTLVFDAFEQWHGPWGPVPVDPLRGEILAHLPPGVARVDNTMHCCEHSLEALVPLLQHRLGERLSIVPILVPYADWEQLADLSDALAGAITASIERHHWKLGEDLVIVISSDAVHYGDDFGHHPFGNDAGSYIQAVERDRDLARRYLEGPIQPANLQSLLYHLVDERDVRRYRLPWCGRFSIPFGLEVLRKTARASGEGVPSGHLLSYETSLSLPLLPVGDPTLESGLGTTAPSNHHHWVGYAAIGYRFPDDR